MPVKTMSLWSQIALFSQAKLFNHHVLKSVIAVVIATVELAVLQAHLAEQYAILVRTRVSKVISHLNGAVISLFAHLESSKAPWKPHEKFHQYSGN